MATMYSELRGNETEGEKLVFTKLRNKLPDEYMVWHSITKKQEMDFIILHPVYGIWIVEVKDWFSSQILSAGEKNFYIVEKGQEIEKPNPFYQAKQNSYYIKELLEKHQELKQTRRPHIGKLILPINAFAVFVNINASEFKEKGLGTYIAPQRVWLKDFIEDPYADDREREKILLATRDVAFECNLNHSLINLIKSEIGVPKVYDVTTGNNTGTLDNHQTNLVNFDINKQVAIEGPAGSGKSIVLLKRALYIHEKKPDWEIGIFCFNALMANYLRIMLEQEQVNGDGKIEIHDIYDWAYNIGFKTYFSLNRGAGRSYEMQLVDAYNQNGGKVEKQYDAILIDEGQDSKDIYIRIYRAMLRNQSGGFTFFYDNRQNIYNAGSVVERLKNFGFVMSEKSLVKQQRSVLVLLAIGFYEKFNEPAKSSAEIMHRVLDYCEKIFFDVKNLILAAVTGLARLFGLNNNSQVNIKDELKQAVTVNSAANLVEICTEIAKRVKELAQSGKAQFGDILMLFAKREVDNGGVQKINVPKLIQETLQQNCIPYTYIDKEYGAVFDGARLLTQSGLHNDNRRTADLANNTVKVMTIHASKGYDAKYVFVIGFDDIDKLGNSPVAEVGYVALTRAKVQCNIFFCEKTYPVTALLEIMENIK